jgi:23S rRNA (adenine2030-N6)-methyltransferase
MLAYRHAFHAGNHGDVLKHLVLVAVLRYMTSKPAPLAVIDTHAGAGGYALDGRYAAQTGEARDGVGALWPQSGDASLPAPLADYLDVVRLFNPDGKLVQYPGSPAIALELLRPGDSLALYEKHPTDERQLRALAARQVSTALSAGAPSDPAAARATRAPAKTQATASPRLRRARPHVSVHLADGFEGVARELPPRTRRGLVLIDPSYELKTDYARTLSALRECLRRCATATVIVWYPRVQLVEARQLPRRLIASAGDAPRG